MLTDRRRRNISTDVCWALTARWRVEPSAVRSCVLTARFRVEAYSVVSTKPTECWRFELSDDSRWVLTVRLKVESCCLVPTGSELSAGNCCLLTTRWRGTSSTTVCWEGTECWWDKSPDVNSCALQASCGIYFNFKTRRQYTRSNR